MIRHIATLLLLGAAVVVEVSAQTSSVRFNSEADPKNFAHASFLGSGIYTADGRQIYILRIEMAFKIHPEEERRWEARFTLRPTIVFYDFKSSDESNFDLPDTLGSLSILPGLEFRLPVLDNWRLEPFAGVGPAVEFETDTITWIYGLGVESRLEFAGSRGKLLLWNSLIWAGNWESDVAPRDDFVVFETTIEWRHALRSTFMGNPADFGPLIRSELYFDALRVDPPTGEGSDINRRYEAGLTWGPRERAVKWKISIPRFGLTYRFGDGDSGYRLLMTTRF